MAHAPIMLPSLMDCENNQLEYLNLSSDEELQSSVDDRPHKCTNYDRQGRQLSSQPLQTSSEFYSFEDYRSEEPVEQSVDEVYNQIINLIRDNKTVSNVAKTSLRCSHSLPSMEMRPTLVDEVGGKPLRNSHHHHSKLNRYHHRPVSRADSDSSSSTNASCNKQIQRPPPPRPRRANAALVENRRRKLLSKSWRAPEPVQCNDDFSSTDMKTDSILYALSNKYTGVILAENTSESPNSTTHDTTANKLKDNQGTSIRTEQLLNGIAELVKDESLNSGVKPARPIRRHPPLPTSKSSPMLTLTNQPCEEKHKTSQSKPASPITVHPAQTKKVTFSRKGSNSSQNSGENENSSKTLDRPDKKKNADNPAAVLFEAVENFNFEKIVAMLDTDNNYVNCVNNDGLSPLDVALLTNHVAITRILVKHGAKPKLLADITQDVLQSRLGRLIQEAEQQVAILSGKINKKENEKKLNQWEFKHRLFRRMRSGFDQAGLPGRPLNVKLSVASDTSLSVRFDNAEVLNGTVVTRYKVEWSTSRSFQPLTGEKFISDLHSLEYEIPDLQQGKEYYIRVTAWNMKGFGLPTASDPPYAIPSSWRQVEDRESRCNLYDSEKVLNLHTDVRSARYSDDGSNSPNDSPTPQRKKESVKKGIRGLFSSGVKFQKSLKRGVYFACVFYSDEKILITAEDNIPIVEVDENYSGGSIHADFHWMMKVACQWDGVRQLKQDMERLSGLSSVHLRNQLLTATLQMQDILGVTDLGQLFYRPVRDNNGSIVFVTINQINDPKQVGNMANVKWQTQLKLAKNMQPSDPLVSSLSEMILYQQVSSCPVSRGLYLGYLKVKINLENIRMLVPELNPNVLPHVKVRDCPSVSKPEWQSLLDLSQEKSKRSNDSQEIVEFRKQIMKAARRLTDSLDIPQDQVGDHRIYDIEVLEFSKDVSFIVLVPPRDHVCSIGVTPQQETNNLTTEPPNRNDFLDIPVKAFEMIHLLTYQNEFIANYSRTACLVNCEVMLAEQCQREAFSNEELEKTKKQTEEMKKHQRTLEDVWRNTRWAMDVISYARERNSQGITLQQLYKSVMDQSTQDTGSYGRGSDSETGDTGYHSDKHSLGGGSFSEKQMISSYASQNITNNNNGHYYDGEFDYHHMPTVEKEELEPGILRVYAAYNSGLIRGTSVMLHVTPRTTAREVINLVVMQLNAAVVRKGMAGPIYADEQLPDFCLVAVIGPRERVLRDDYKLLQLQNPWTKGRLYVRLKTNLLAALEHGQTTDV